jgi:sugar phosphate isomerase/epimerase
MDHGPRRTATLVAALGFLAGLPSLAVDYHVDCRAGDDARNGRSPETAWRSVAQVSTTTFQPGDGILLRRGTRCTGVLWPKGSGEPGRPIRLAAYGEGPLPIVDAAGGEAAVKLFDQQHWHVETIEATGGNPYGIHVSGSKGTLRHFRIRNVVVHGVGGEVKTKASGLLVVAAGGGGQTFEDVVIDGVTAYDTTQWAGIEVHGAAWEDKGLRARNVTIRNSVVHDVYGDGIVLFQVEDGLIERSAAWRTGLQPVQTIGTPNGIWTWRCRRCTVRWTEGFFVDSPGVDGGVYDIDWGNDDNVVEHNFGHDAMGYCASVFAAAGETTTNSVVRHNVCVNNGRSPKLARRQGDFFVSTWEGGRLDGVRVENNTFYWNPPIDVPVVQMDHADFTGTRPNVFEGNLIHSAVPSLIHSSDGLRFDRNLYWYAGAREPSWSYGGRQHEGFAAYRRDSGQDATGLFADPKLTATMRLRSGSPAAGAGTILGADIGPFEPETGSAGAPAKVDLYPGRWALVSDLGENDASRAQVVFLQSALEQYGERGLVVAAGVPAGAPSQLPHDWNLGAISSFTATPSRAEKLPTTLLVAPDGAVVRRWEGLAPPADLGLTLRALIGPPAGSPPVELPADEAIAGVSAAIPPGQNLRKRVGVFLRCTGQEDPRKALEAVRSLGLERVQVSRLPDRFYPPEGAREFASLLKETGVRADAVAVVFEGESYKDRESVMRTVGLRPAALRTARMEYAKKVVGFAKAIGTTIVTFHMGFLPKDPEDPVYGEMREAVSSLAAYAAAKGITLSLETGQETGEELKHFLDSITVARVGVNFDTANLVLYGLDDPPRALARLLDRVTSLHVKDGLPPDDKHLLGREVPLGEGRAQVRECLRLLDEAGFRGPLIIENYTWRDRGTDPLAELARARDFILSHDPRDAGRPGP